MERNMQCAVAMCGHCQLGPFLVCRDGPVFCHKPLAPCTNPFRSIIVRAVEVLYACDEALRLIGDYQPPDPPSIDVPQREATGFGCTEAPRGLLHNRYQISADGTITDAKIVPPTSQNQRIIEADLRAFVTDRLELPYERLTWECEQAGRSYDPCISCAAHFLDLRVQRT